MSVRFGAVQRFLADTGVIFQVWQFPSGFGKSGFGFGLGFLAQVPPGAVFVPNPKVSAPKPSSSSPNREAFCQSRKSAPVSSSFSCTAPKRAPGRLLGIADGDCWRLGPRKVASEDVAAVGAAGGVVGRGFAVAVGDGDELRRRAGALWAMERRRAPEWRGLKMSPPMAPRLGARLLAVMGWGWVKAALKIGMRSRWAPAIGFARLGWVALPDQVTLQNLCHARAYRRTLARRRKVACRVRIASTLSLQG